MGVVFQARHIFLKTSHAIKIILPDLVGNDPMLVTRFRQEAMAAAAIHHQNIIAVTDFGVVRGTMPFLVMEFVKGRSLHDLLAEEKRLAPARALEIMSPVCAGMSAAHRQNIVHRDLKPLNIMMQDGLPIAEGLKILDFGLAKIKSGELLGSFVQAKTSGLMGSPFYMAPEQWSDEEPDARADIYSLGVILYQMLGGDVPFKGASIPSIMKKHLTLEPPPLKSLGVEVPPVIESVVRHALEKDAARRPANVSAFIDELRVAVESAGGALGPEVRGRNTSDLQTMISMPHISMPPEPQPSQPLDAGTIVRVFTNPPQSRVFVNNISVGLSDERGELTVPHIPSGVHRVRVAHEGFADWEQQIDCNGGECHVHAQLHSLIARSQPHINADQAATGNSSPLDPALLGQGALDTDEQTVVRQSQQPEQKGFKTTPIIAVPQGDAGGGARASSHNTQAQLRAGSTGRLEDSPYPSPLTDERPAVRAQENARAIPHGPTVEERKPSALPKILIAAALALVLVGGGVGAYLFIQRKGAPVVQHNGNPGGVKPNDPGDNRPPQPPAKAELIEMPGGTLMMGRNGGKPQEGPAHSVTLPAFAMDRTEVTNAEYAAFVKETNHAPPTDWNGPQPPAGHELLPVVNVSYDDAVSFAGWRSKRDGVQYRLPTEEEWEYAARGGDQGNLYPWGNTWQGGRAVTQEDGFSTAQPVGSIAGDKTRWGVMDMLGNVREWTSSKASFYKGSQGVVLPEYKESVVVRGGSYVSSHDDKDIPISGTYRDWFSPKLKHPTLGFRLVRPGS
jgi:serine/threonine-protein kinase